MKGLILTAALLCGMAWADDASDRVAIRALVDQLNSNPANPALYVDGFRDSKELSTLEMDVQNSPPLPTSTSSRVQISKRPWGEATITATPTYQVIVWTSKIVVQSLRFVSKDVVAVEVFKEKHSSAENTVKGPLGLLLLKKDHKLWKIDTARVLGTVGPDGLAQTR